jgi:hypothetical protein
VFEPGCSSGETRSLRADRRKIPHAALLEPVKEIPESSDDKEKGDGPVAAAVLCSYDAENVEKITRRISRAGNIWMNFRLLAPNWRGNSFRLRLMGLAENC